MIPLLYEGDFLTQDLSNDYIPDILYEPAHWVIEIDGTGWRVDGREEYPDQTPSLISQISVGAGVCD